jgi:hypothetical protein
MKENDMTNNNYEREPLIGLIAEAEAAGSTIHVQMKNILLIEHELRKAWAAVQNAKRIDMDSIRAEIPDLNQGDPHDVVDELDM